MNTDQDPQGQKRHVTLMEGGASEKDPKRIQTMSSRMGPGAMSMPMNSQSIEAKTASIFQAAYAKAEQKSAQPAAVIQPKHMPIPTPTAGGNVSQGETHSAAPEGGYLCRANDVIHLKLIKSQEDIDDDKITFRPKFTHQHFDDEQIYGYQGLRIDWYMIGSSLVSYLKVSWENQVVVRSADFGFGMGGAQRKADPVAAKLTTHLPEALSDLTIFKSHIGGLFDPSTLGLRRVHAYNRVADAGDVDAVSYVTYVGDFRSPALKAYHARLQPYLLFFVDAASYIDDTDMNWMVFLTFEKRESRDPSHKQPARYCIVGFSTVYRFYAHPDREKHRISQMLVFPPFQRQGHASHLFRAIYLEASAREAIQINVEDPSDAFTQVRLLVDCSLLLEKELIAPDELVLSKEKCAAIQSQLLLNPDHIRRCFEAFQLLRVNVLNEASYKPYRLMVKKRLYHAYQETLESLEDPNQMKQTLHSIYLEEEQNYRLALDRLKKDHAFSPAWLALSPQ